MFIVFLFFIAFRCFFEDFQRFYIRIVIDLDDFGAWEPKALSRHQRYNLLPLKNLLAGCLAGSLDGWVAELLGLLGLLEGVLGFSALLVSPTLDARRGRWILSQ